MSRSRLRRAVLCDSLCLRGAQTFCSCRACARERCSALALACFCFLVFGFGVTMTSLWLIVEEATFEKGQARWDRIAKLLFWEP